MPAFLLIFLGVFILDATTKFLVRTFLPVGTEVHLLPIFSLTHVQNTGIAFGLFPGKNYLFICVGLLLTYGLVSLAFRMHRENQAGSLILAVVLGGAWGNLVDRIFYGRVTDFLVFYVGPHHCP